MDVVFCQNFVIVEYNNYINYIGSMITLIFDYLCRPIKDVPPFITVWGFVLT